jgi:trehalose synthase-fused probable maltokinase
VTALPERDRLAAALLSYVKERRWFRSKARAVRAARVADVVPLGAGQLVLLEVDFSAGEGELYAVPLVPGQGIPGLPFSDGLATGESAGELLNVAREGRTVAGERGALQGETTPLFAELADRPLRVTVPAGEQTNSTLLFEDRLLMKIYRLLDPGESPELEIGRFLTSEGARPRVLGGLSYQGRSLGVVHEFLPNEGDAWSAALASVRAFLGGGAGFAAAAATLGRRTAEMHQALARGTSPAFAPEPFTDGDRQVQAARVRTMMKDHLALLASRMSSLPERTRPLAGKVLEGQALLEQVIDRFRGVPTTVMKTRIHGDLHLGQVLVHGDDFIIIDFEGEPARPLAERRAKNCPLRDVMGMVRSFDYAPEAVLRTGGGDAARARRWTEEASSAYLGAYFDGSGDGEERQRLLDFYQVEKVIYEVGYELNNRPDWVEIPVRGLATIIGVTA